MVLVLLLGSVLFGKSFGVGLLNESCTLYESDNITHALYYPETCYFDTMTGCVNTTHAMSQNFESNTNCNILTGEDIYSITDYPTMTCLCSGDNSLKDVYELILEEYDENECVLSTNGILQQLFENPHICNDWLSHSNYLYCSVDSVVEQRYDSRNCSGDYYFMLHSFERHIEMENNIVGVNCTCNSTEPSTDQSCALSVTNGSLWMVADGECGDFNGDDAKLGCSDNETVVIKGYFDDNCSALDNTAVMDIAYYKQLYGYSDAICQCNMYESDSVIDATLEYIVANSNSDANVSDCGLAIESNAGFKIWDPKQCYWTGADWIKRRCDDATNTTIDVIYTNENCTDSQSETSQTYSDPTHHCICGILYTDAPIDAPTLHPTNNPTTHPTMDPTLNPTVSPTLHPTMDPTLDPTFNPTLHPTLAPTLSPTQQPTTSDSIPPQSKSWVVVSLISLAIISAVL